MVAKGKLSLFSLVLLIVAAIDSIRNFPASALFGSQLIFFFIFAALIFLIPTALISAELSAAFPEKGGVYHWVSRAFGEKWAMLAIWLQWINTMVWYPTILLFIAGTAAYLVDPALLQNKLYLSSSVLVVFWGLTLLNLGGIHLSAKINNICALIGMIFPMLFLIVLGGVWCFSGEQIQIDFSFKALVPSFADSNHWVALIAVMTSFLGFELSGVHVNDIKEPQKNFPKAVLFSSFFILVSMILGSLAIAVVLPQKEINLIAGVMQVFGSFFAAFGLEGFLPVLTLLVVVGSIGLIINWLISPAKGLLQAAEYGYLPPFFTKKNKAGVPANILVTQAIMVSLVCPVILLVPSVNGFYWFLTALSTELYMIMYILMFLAALKLHFSYGKRSQSFKIPGKTAGMFAACLLGLFGCALTIFVTFVSPGTVDVGSPLSYFLLICGANVVTIAPVFLFFFYKKRVIPK